MVKQVYIGKRQDPGLGPGAQLETSNGKLDKEVEVEPLVVSYPTATGVSTQGLSS